MIRASALPLALTLAIAWSAGAAADEERVHQQVKQGVREAGHAVAGAGERVSAEIQEKKAQTNTGRGYGSAGCGLGSIAFGPGSGFTQIFAATTNTLFGTQTFGITSGTSNCARPARGRDAARTFVETNRSALAKDIARGSGETIIALTRLAGCRDALSVGAGLQHQFPVIFSNAAQSDRDVSLAVIDVLRADASLDCRALG